MSHGPLAARQSDGPLSRWVAFHIADQRYALDIRRVQEVVLAADIEPVPGAPASVLGVINLRGRIVTVVDLGRCLGLPPGAATMPCTVVIADASDGVLGLRVDGIAEVCSLADGAIRPVPPTLGRQPDPLVRGVIGRAEPMLILLEAALLVQRAAAA